MTARAIELEKLRRHARILVDLARLSMEAQSLDELMNQSTVHVARAVEIDHVKVMRYRPEKGDLFLEAGVGWKEGLVRAATFRADLASPAGHAFMTGEPVVIEDLGATDEYRLHPSLADHGIVSLANVPVLLDGAAWGVLEVDSTVPREFGEDTINFMLAAATIMGAAIHRRDAENLHFEALRSVALEGTSREVLLREMQHRVKNNFQIILSMMNMRRRRMKSDEGKAALDEISSRINAISLAHNQLSPTQGLRTLELEIYLQALCDNIQQQLDRVTIATDLQEQAIAVERAVPLGLILNELITNSVKHAFGDQGGAVAVKLEVGVGHGEARLTVSDDGRGLQTPKDDSGSGLKLVKSLARQIGGVIETPAMERGTTTSVTFPIIV